MRVFLAKHIERLMGVVTGKLRIYRLNFIRLMEKYRNVFKRFMGKYQNVLCRFIQKYRNVFSRFIQKYVNLIIFFFPLSYFPAFPYLCKFNFSEP